MQFFLFTSFFQQLATLEDNATMRQIRRLVHLIPTDPSVVEAMDAVSYGRGRSSSGLDTDPIFSVSFFREKSLICLDGKYVTPHRVGWMLFNSLVSISCVASGITEKQRHPSGVPCQTRKSNDTVKNI